jgi:hypothetical protein
MFYALFDIENTGNLQIKNQEIRFEFTDDSEILDVFYCPQKVEPEMELKDLSEDNLGKHERKFRIGVIKPKEKLGFRFIIQGSINESLDFKHYTKNDDDIGFIKVEDKKITDDIEQVKYFLMNCLITFVLIPLMKEIFRDINTPISYLILFLLSLSNLAFFGFLIIPHFEGFIKSVINVVSTSSKKKSDMQSEKIGLVVMGDSVTVEHFAVSSDKNEG